MTLLTLLPTSALAASGSGTGIKPTDNTNYWTTRLLHDGTPYSYKPPMAAGKLLYCLDRGYGYRWGTASFLNSYTYTSATGADADTVLKTALAQSGMGELDAQQLENFKWMMTFISDYKGDIPGSLFMAAQTYVWDHQTFKGEGDGDIDGGGYANADTYEMYLGYIDWMLKEKAKEDAEFQRQIEEYAEQGIIATVVEDEAAKWAVYAKSSVKGRQAFFNYYAPRKLVTNTSEPGKPPAGDADITLRKVAAGTTRGLDGAKFNIYRDGQIVGSDVTQNGGIIEVKDVTKGLWSFVETEAPEGYCADSTPISVYVDTTDGDKQYTVTAENYALPDMKITKRDAMSGKPIAGTVFSIKSVTGSYSTSVTTGTDGSATLSAIPAGVYVVREESVPEPYIVTNTEQTVALRPGKTSEVTFVDYEKPGLEIVKKNIANGEPIEGVTYRIEQIDGSFSTSATTDNHGRIFLDSVPVGTFKVTEINVPSHVILCPIPQEVALKPGETSTVTFFNALKPSLEIRKVDSVTGDPVKGAKFQIWYGSNHTDTGELNDLGTYFSDASGKIILPEIKDGWYKVTELEPASGYAIKEAATQECFISGGESKILTFENTPLSAIIIRKVDSESGQPLEGAWFRIRYLGGTSGTGGTVIGEYRTSSNGTIVVTGLKAGTYVCEEISAPDGYVITDATETVYLSGKDQDVITVTFGNDTRTFEEVTGKDIRRIHQMPIPFLPEEREIYNIVLKEFYRIQREYYNSTGNSRKDALMRLIQQITLLLRISAAPDCMKEYEGETPLKEMAVVEALARWPEEVVAIGVRHTTVLDRYAAAIREYLPDRPLFVVTGSTVTFAKRRALRDILRDSQNGILLCTQQSLPSSVNFEFVNKIIIPEMHYNNAGMSQFYMRFVRYTSTEKKDLYFPIYIGSLESNLMQMVLAKEKLTMFMKGQDADMDEIYAKFGVDYDLLSTLMTRETDDEGHLRIHWGEQKIA